MPEKIRFSAAVDQFLTSMSAQGLKPGTLRNHRAVLRRFVLVNGDLFLASVDARHVDRHFIAARATRTDSSLSVDHASLCRFFGWAVQSRYVSRFANPMDGRRPPRAARRERNRIPVSDFARLLDAAERYHPRDRIVVALGLYLFLRAGEIATLRVGDVRLDSGEVSVFRHKTRQADVMPISPELDRELRVWLTWYGQAHGNLDPRWYLAPAKQPWPQQRDPRTGWLMAAESRDDVPLKPDAPITGMQRIPARAMEALGYPTRGEDGKPLWEGMHTLRRSAARARFDTLENRGYDGAVRHVQMMLGHASMAQTEHYLGLELDRVKRNELVRGGPMFDTGANVVPLTGRAGFDGKEKRAHL